MTSFIEKVSSKVLNLKMTWLVVIIFSIATGVYTGLINEVAFLRDTSFQDIATTFEWWILFAMLIIVNQKNWWNSGLKTFVFFLISQTVIFLVETPFEGFHFNYWIYWMKVAMLTLPAGCVMWFVKKKNFLSSALLSLPLTLLLLEVKIILVEQLDRSLYSTRPHFHILTTIFCLVQFVFWLLILSKDKKHMFFTSTLSIVFLVLDYMHISDYILALVSKIILF